MSCPGQLVRRGQCLRGFVFLAGRPIEICQSEVSRHRFRIDLDSFLERGFCLGLAIGRLLHRAKAGVANRVLRIEFDGFLDLLNRTVQILQAGQRVGEQDCASMFFRSSASAWCARVLASSNC